MHVKVNIASADRQGEGGGRDVRVLFLHFVSLFFLLWELFYIFQSCVLIFAKKSDRTRCLAVSILEYNYWVRGTILTGIRSRQREGKRFGFLKEERNSVMIHR